MRRLASLAMMTWFVAACSLSGPGVTDDESSEDSDDGTSSSSGNGTSSGTGSGSGSGSGGSGSGSTGSGSMLNSDNDPCGLTDEQEIAMGTDPMALDSDGDGDDDCAEVECLSNPASANQKCYACGWKRGDPGNLTSTGSSVGSVIANISLVDQCGEQVSLWDFYGKYHILWMTAAW